MANLLCLALAVALLGTAVAQTYPNLKINFYGPVPAITKVSLVPTTHYGNQGLTSWPSDSTWKTTSASSTSTAKNMALTLKPKTIQIDDPVTKVNQVSLPQPVIEGPSGAGIVVAPTTIVASGMPFKISFTNQMPFQPLESCSVGTPGSISNGFKDTMWTNIHTHGLRVDPGATSLEDLCQTQAASYTPAITLNQYYCNSPTVTDTTNRICNVVGDNIVQHDRPLMKPIGYQTTIQYTYPLPPHVPGITWIHPHQHGSSSYQTATSAGALIISEKTIPLGLEGLYETIDGVQSRWDCLKACPLACNPTTSAYPIFSKFFTKAQQQQLTTCMNNCAAACPPGCESLKNIMNAQSNEVAPVLAFSVLLLRNSTEDVVDFGTRPRPDDDSQLFLACNSVPSSPISCPGVTPSDPTRYDKMNAKNLPGRDHFLLNSVFQPDVALTAGRYSRFQLLDMMTMKWLDLAIFKVPAAPAVAGTPVVFTDPAPCRIVLLAKDGIPLPVVPRPTMSVGPRMSATTSWISDLMMASGTRADVLIKCDVAGNYMLVSGAGPFTKHPDCGATHCELVGDEPYSPNVTPKSANHFYKGQEYNAAVLATVTVAAAQVTYPWKAPAPCPGNAPSWVWDMVSESADPTFESAVCRSKLEQFAYLDNANFPQSKIDQCFSFMNNADGAGCNVNGCSFGDYEACIDQGTTQMWQLRDITFHPFHLHESPIQAKKLPACLNSNGFFTNQWQINDWGDIWQFPMCQCTDPPSADPLLPAARSCDRMVGTFPGTRYQSVTQAGTCADRYAVFHCHVLSHEDEGCMALVHWKCPDATTGAPTCNAQTLGQCPDVTTDPPVCAQQNIFAPP